MSRPSNVVHIAYLEGEDISELAAVYRTSQVAKREIETRHAEQTGDEDSLRWGAPIKDDETELYSWCGFDAEDTEIAWVAEVEIR